MTHDNCIEEIKSRMLTELQRYEYKLYYTENGTSYACKRASKFTKQELVVGFVAAAEALDKHLSVWDHEQEKNRLLEAEIKGLKFALTGGRDDTR